MLYLSFQQSETKFPVKNMVEIHGSGIKVFISMTEKSSIINILANKEVVGSLGANQIAVTAITKSLL